VQRKKVEVGKYGVTKRSISEINNLHENQTNPPSHRNAFAADMRLIEGTIEDFTDSLEDNRFKGALNKATKEYNTTPKGQSQYSAYFNGKDNAKDADRKKSTYEEQLNNIVNKVRPFSPPFSSAMMNTGEKFTMITKKNNETVIINNEAPKNPLIEEKKENANDHNGDNLLEVIFDPVLNCYYHPKTNSYYELKE